MNILCRIPVPNNIQTNLHRMITKKENEREIKKKLNGIMQVFLCFFSSLRSIMQFNFKVCMRTRKSALNRVECTFYEFLLQKEGVLQIPDLDPNSNHFVVMAVVHRVHRAMLVVHSLHSIQTNGVRTDHEFP